MSSAFSDNSITNNGLVGVSSASQLSNDNNMSAGNSVNASSSNDEWIDGYKRDSRSNLPSWLDWITGYDRQYDNARYQQWMSDTAIQRRVADAKLAGINPLFALSNNSGADSGVSFSDNTSASGAKAVGGVAKNVVSSIAKIILMLMLFA